MIEESFPGTITCWGAVVFEKLVKECHRNNFRLTDHDTKFILARKTYFHNIVYSFRKNYSISGDNYFHRSFPASLFSNCVSLL